MRTTLSTGSIQSLVSCLLLAAVGTSAGCVQEEAQAPPEVPVANEPEFDRPKAKPAPDRSGPNDAVAAGVGKRRKYTGISFEIPGNWKNKAAQMVDSKYVVSTDNGDIEITLTSMGGGIDANLDRWVKQVRLDPNDEPSWSTIDIDGVEAKQVDVRGRYTSGVGGDTGTRQQTRLIGIAVPLPVRDFFIKLLGPREAVVDFDEELESFLKTAKRED